MKVYVVEQMYHVPEDSDPPVFGVMGVFRDLNDALMCIVGGIAEDLEEDGEEPDIADLTNQVKDLFRQKHRKGGLGLEDNPWEFNADEEFGCGGIYGLSLHGVK